MSPCPMTRTSCISAVQISSTEGGVVRIADGLEVGDKVVVNVPDEISDGSRIQPVALVQN